MLGSEGTGSLVPPQYRHTKSVLENRRVWLRKQQNKTKQKKKIKQKTQLFPQMSVPQPQLSKPLCLLLASPWM